MQALSISNLEKTYANGTQVQLTAVPDLGWQFDHWESTEPLGDQATQPIITVTVTKNVTYTAHFAENPSANMLYLPIITR